MSDPTEASLFDELLSRYTYPRYDPLVHLTAKVAGDRWGMDPKSALEKLRRIGGAEGLVEIEVIGEAGKLVKAFVRG
jgi:hypothetical protein